MSIFKLISKDLQAVNDKLNREYLMKAGHLSSFAHLEFSPLNSIIRPAMVILSSRLYKYKSTEVISLAAVVQFIYMASTIHSQINDDNKDIEDKDPKDGCQFPVLVGDYLYGKFFTSLCNADIVRYLSPLSEVICSIHEGGILRQKSLTPDITVKAMKSLQKEIAYKETGTLFETGCRLAADLAGANREDQNNITNFAKELGTAYGMMENKVDSNDIVPHLDNAGTLLNKLPRNDYHETIRILLSQLRKDMPILIETHSSLHRKGAKFDGNTAAIQK